ncbi:hypothetical protein [Sphingobium cloacae]|uniref:Lipoprotein n=1 Tax=Sphingobium cloacae TaxID=120107 RepID=A0A1E1F1D7_9SPHN|nr:hypothetical protein [Sphingobium cloacae]BAV64316.1 hypothetical protein SCLO_1012760 [Sphingobium cloacae]
MTARATLMAMTMLAFAGGCSSSGGERGADPARQESAVSTTPVSAPPPLAEAPRPRPPLPAKARDLPPDKMLSSIETETAMQAKMPDEQPLSDPGRPPYRPVDLPASGSTAPVAPFPQEVTNYMVERDSCDHFRGEEPYDADRRAYLAENIAELCTGTDGRLAALRMRYADDPTVLAALSGYEERIESGSGSGKYIGK